MNAPNPQAVKFLEYFDSHAAEITDDLFELLRFKSISSEPEFSDDMAACANWLKNYLETCHLKSEIWETSGHPVVYAENLSCGDNQPTIILYNHYDVQPVDPLEKWVSPPFEPIIKDGNILARGAGDNKGQLFYTIHAIKALHEINTKLPINVKIILDGEEEAGSSGLSGIIDEKAGRLCGDYLLAVDSGFESENKPSVTLGMRGIVLFKLTVTGPNSDLHSGTYGGVAENPNHVLVKLLADLHEKNGKVAIPGFYDDVIDLTEEEQASIDTDFDEEKYTAMVGVPPLGGEKDLPPWKSGSVRPTLEINGISGGYEGSGFKTVIPSIAAANISCRLVPNQDPVKTGRLVAAFIKAQPVNGVKIEVEVLPAYGKPIRNSPNAKISRIVAKAYEDVTGVNCGYNLGGGSIPIIPELVDASGAEALMMGFMTAGDNAHAPNEIFGLKRLKLGLATVARVLESLGE